MAKSVRGKILPLEREHVRDDEHSQEWLCHRGDEGGATAPPRPCLGQDGAGQRKADPFRQGRNLRSLPSG